MCAGTHAKSLRDWMKEDGGMFAQAWVAGIGVKPQSR